MRALKRALLMGLAAAWVGTAAHTVSATTPRAPAVAAACTGDRWPIRTLGDDDASLVNLTPVTTTVTDLLALPAPDVVPRLARAAPVELTTYTITVTLIDAIVDSAGDLALTVAEPADPSQTLVVKFLDTVNCALSTDQTLVDRMQRARDAVVEHVGAPSSNRPTAASGTADITGVGFVGNDAPLRAGATRIFLHPVLDFVPR